MPAPQILSVGKTKSLMVSRSMLLRHAGYGVEEAYSLREALRILDSVLLDAVLICHTIPPADLDSLVFYIRERWKTLPIFCIDNTGVSPPIKGCHVIPSTPEELLAALNAAIKAISPAG